MAAITCLHPYQNTRFIAVEAKRDDEKLPRPIKPAISKCSIRRLLLPHNLNRLIFTILRETRMRTDEVLSLNVDDVMLHRRRDADHPNHP
jgi:integrase